MYSVFLETNFLKDFNKTIPWPDDNFGINTIDFKNGYESFLRENDYLGPSEIDTHYKRMISGIIAEEFYKRLV